jgi:hypothetical protein
MTYFIQHIKKFSPLLFLFFVLPVSAAEDDQTTISLPLPARLSLEATSGDNTFGEGDAMFPFWGDTEHIFYGDIGGKYGDDSAWFASIGLGGRKIIHDDTILGTYLFMDYNKTPNANYFTVFNPGIEFMTNQWDGHLNGYLPTGRQSAEISTFTGSSLGLNTTSFSAHTQYDAVFNLLEDVGHGVDLEIGHTFHPSSWLKKTRVFGGGYYFTPHSTSNINGIEAGFEIPLRYKWASLEVRDSYDNLNHNTFLLTLKLTFGGLEQSESFDIHDRMLDQIPRHLGNLNNGNGIPSQKALVNTGSTVVARDNIWFFTEGTPTTVEGFQSCTFEHPCTGLAQSQIDTINGLSPKANFYFAPGVYDNPDVGSGFNFYNGQNVFGRTSDFTQLATSDNRPLINDTVILNGNNNIYNIRIDGHSIETLGMLGGPLSFQTGLLTASTSNGIVNIYNSDINQSSTTDHGMSVANNSNVGSLNIYNTTITSNLSNTLLIGVGVGNLRNSELNLFNSTVTTSSSNAEDLSTSLSFGVVNNESGLLNISNTSITVNAIRSSLVASVLNNSSIDNRGTVTITGSTITTNGNNTINSGSVNGILNRANGQPNSANVNISQSTISVTSNGSGDFSNISTYSITTGGSGTMSINNSTINTTGNDGNNVFGINVGDSTATLNYKNIINSINLSGTATGAPTQNNSGILNDQGGNQCFENGSPRSCE